MTLYFVHIDKLFNILCQSDKGYAIDVAPVAPVDEAAGLQGHGGMADGQTGQLL